MTLRWIAAAALGVLGAAGTGALAGAARPDHFALTALVFAGLALVPLLTLGWVLFVAPRSHAPDEYAEDNVERAWFEKVSSGAFTDIVTVLGVGLAVISILDLTLDAQLVILAVLVTAMGDAIVRYALLTHRERLAAVNVSQS